MKTKKFLLWTVIFALVFASLSGSALAQENSQPQRIIVEPKLPFKINVWVDKGCGSTYRVGENLIVYFESNQDCYLTLFDFFSDGHVRQIFPNRYRQDNFIRAHKVYTIPGERDSFKFGVTPPPGAETIKAVATLSPWRFTRETVKYKEAFPIVSKSAREFFSKFKQKIRPVPRPRWAESSCTFYVGSWVRPGRGKIRVTSEPTHASVYLDGKYRGTTPLTVRRLKVGWHEVAVIKEGYRIYVKDVYVDRGERVYLEAELEKLEYW